MRRLTGFRKEIVQTGITKTDPAENGRVSAPLLMALGVLFFHLKPLFWGVSFHNPGAFHYDVLAMVPSTFHAIGELVSTGHPPLWFAGQNMGSPLLGIYLPAILHPLIVVMGLFDFSRGMAFFSLVNSLLICLFAFLFFRRCGASYWGSGAAGFLLSMSGFVSWLGLIYSVVLSLPWMLCWLWSAMGLARRASLSGWLFNTASVFMILLCGDVQMVMEGAYLLPVWFLIWAFRSRVPPASLYRSLALMSAGAVAGWLLSAFQLLPAMLLFSRTVTSRVLSLDAYAASFPEAAHSITGGLGLFSRLFENLYLTLFTALLVAVSFFRRRKNPAFQASILLTAAVALIAISGRYGPAFIPYHMPMLKLFVRHYKLAVILQGPLFVGVALGFDEISRALLERNRSFSLAAAVTLVLTLIVMHGIVWRLIVLCLAGVIWLAIRSGRREIVYACAALLLMADAGSCLWRTPYKLSIPDPDPLYVKYSHESACQSRVQGMYPWISRMTSDVEQPIPPHGNGYFGDQSIDSWLLYPIKNHAWFLDTITKRVSAAGNGVFKNLDFATPFKSTDFITPRNRRLVNLAALRYFFLQDMALSEADVFPILSDPEYHANPSRPRAFLPWKRTVINKRPVLISSGFGSFDYKMQGEPGDSFSADLTWKPSLKKGSAWVVLSLKNDPHSRPVFARAISPDEKKGAAKIEAGLPSGGEYCLSFSLYPATTGSGIPDVEWLDPLILNPSKTIKYREGEELMVFENTEAFGRARIVHRARLVTENMEALKLMRDPDSYHPQKETIIMNAGAPLTDGPEPSPEESARIASCVSDRVVINADLKSKGYLVLADTYYPGWEAFDRDGRELRIYRADMSLRALSLPKGEHEITFIYLPADFRVGLFATLASLAAFIGLVLARRLD